VGKDALLRVLKELGHDDAVVGRLTYIGSGLTYRTVRVDVEVGGARHNLVVRVPGSDAGEDQPDEALLEAEVRAAIRAQNPPFHVPKLWGFALVEHGLAVVEEEGAGIPLDDSSFRNLVSPLDVTVQTAAQCHALDASSVEDIIEAWPDCREHALDLLVDLELVGTPEARRAAEWGRANLPPTSPPRLLHGDLLGQNILVVAHPERVVTLIDWGEACVGDPAYDLACVSRGNRRLFGERKSLADLIEAYNVFAPEPVTWQRVRLYELCILGDWLAEAIDDEQDDVAEHYARKLERAMRDGPG
jgi:aminoglycoside phosphotransferase (APT) family kinase protein